MATPQPLLWWLAVLVAVAAIDVGAYLAAAGRAQGAADAAALAAVATEDVVRPGGPAAHAVAEANGARLDTCTCLPAAGRAQVTVSVEVPGVVVPHLVGDRRITASAAAQLVAPRPTWPGDP